MAKYFIHKTADVDDSAEIGANTKIWHQSQVMPNATIGENCNLGKSVYVDFGVSIGSRVKIQNGVSVYRGVTIEDDCFLGPHMVFTNDLSPRSFTSEFVIIPTLLKRGCSVGANATIICGVTLGEYSMVGAGSVVTKDVDPYGLVVGNPARQIGFVCKCGKRVYKHVKGIVPPVCTTCAENNFDEMK